MPVYGFGDIVLVPSPFTDQSGAKKRPAVVVGGAAHNQTRRRRSAAATNPFSQFSQVCCKFFHKHVIYVLLLITR